MQISKQEIQAMTMEEKSELIDLLWESLENDDYVDDVTDETEEEKQVLRERLEEYKTNPSGAVKWKDLKDALAKRND